MNDITFIEMYTAYEMLPNDDTQAYRMPGELLEDFKAVTTNQAKEIRRLMIQYIYNQKNNQRKTIIDNKFIPFFQKYDALKGNKLLSFKLPKKLLEDFKAITPNQSKILRLLLIEYIYTQRHKATTITK